ncbi:hypothetical protein SLEP1_g14806 [Rubroshorea leprosula]|uniref:Uncharacterized protein n=1 Tax=Rubroshorea leprosula TaxID=152421 RepID=A0AAV5IT68_9ROSI|nr:hypothetical protein SLEP1_g14806 [Rubroshorea leprosula]
MAYQGLYHLPGQALDLEQGQPASMVAGQPASMVAGPPAFQVAGGVGVGVVGFWIDEQQALGIFVTAHLLLLLCLMCTHLVVALSLLVWLGNYPFYPNSQ